MAPDVHRPPWAHGGLVSNHCLRLWRTCCSMYRSRPQIQLKHVQTISDYIKLSLLVLWKDIIRRVMSHDSSRCAAHEFFFCETLISCIFALTRSLNSNRLGGLCQALQTESEKLASRLIRLLFSDCIKSLPLHQFCFMSDCQNISKPCQNVHVPCASLCYDFNSRNHSSAWACSVHSVTLAPLRHCVSPRITDGDSPKVLEIDLNVVRSLCADGIPDEASGCTVWKAFLASGHLWKMFKIF